MKRTDNQYPIFIPSKGRADSLLTMKQLDWMGCDYYVVVEAEEYDLYAEKVKDINKLLVIPKKYFKEYNYDDDKGYDPTISSGDGPARNFSWDKSIELGFKRHWTLDDNIRGFFRLNHNREFKVKSPVFFRWMEIWADKYLNTGIVGPNYHKMVFMKKGNTKPVQLNTRIYSCLLINNSLPLRYESRYSNDTDLAIRTLKNNYITGLFNTFLIDKAEQGSIKGGNTDDYKSGALDKSKKMIVNRHPDICKLVKRKGKLNHLCNYKLFKNVKPVRNPGYVPEVIEIGLRKVK